MSYFSNFPSKYTNTDSLCARGFVLCSPKRPVHCVAAFEAQIALLELKSIISAGYQAVLHVHSAVEEVSVTELLFKLERGTGRKSKKPVRRSRCPYL